MTENLPPRSYPEDPTRGHSGITANTRGILLTGFAMLVMIGLGLFVCWGLVKWLVAEKGVGVAAVDPGPPERREPLPHAVQPNQAFEYQQMVAAKKKVLGSYGWTNRNEGRVRIPIDRAIDLIAEGKLPLESATTAKQASSEN